MIRAQWQKIRDEWRGNRRLRMAVLVVVVILATHAVMTLEDQRRSLEGRYLSDQELLARLHEVNGQATWVGHARRAQEQLKVLHDKVPAVQQAGSAQAELQSWLGELAKTTGVLEPRVRVEETLDVPDHPQMWQVLARLEGQIPPFGQAAFTRAVADGLPWIQVERLEIADGSPARLALIVRGYYRRGEPEAADASESESADVKAKAKVKAEETRR